MNTRCAVPSTVPLAQHENGGNNVDATRTQPIAPNTTARDEERNTA